MSAVGACPRPHHAPPPSRWEPCGHGRAVGDRGAHSPVARPTAPGTDRKAASGVRGRDARQRPRPVALASRSRQTRNGASRGGYRHKGQLEPAGAQPLAHCPHFASETSTEQGPLLTLPAARRGAVVRGERRGAASNQMPLRPRTARARARESRVFPVGATRHSAGNVSRVAARPVSPPPCPEGPPGRPPRVSACPRCPKTSGTLFLVTGNRSSPAPPFSPLQQRGPGAATWRRPGAALAAAASVVRTSQ